MMRFNIVDDHSHRRWSRLLGLKIESDHVYVKEEFYQANVGEITSIQVMAALALRTDPNGQYSGGHIR